jgi:hypothetical protein
MTGLVVRFIINIYESREMDDDDDGHECVKKERMTSDFSVVCSLMKSI